MAIRVAPKIAGVRVKEPSDPIALLEHRLDRYLEVPPDKKTLREQRWKAIEDAKGRLQSAIAKGGDEVLLLKVRLRKLIENPRNPHYRPLLEKAGLDALLD